MRGEREDSGAKKEGVPRGFSNAHLQSGIKLVAAEWLGLVKNRDF